jgi:hypothetical protein
MSGVCQSLFPASFRLGISSFFPPSPSLAPSFPAHQGLVSYNDPVSLYIPEFATMKVYDPITYEGGRRKDGGSCVL